MPAPWNKLSKACRNTGTIPGIAGMGIEDAIARAKQGFQFITAGSDAGFIISGAASGLSALRSGTG